MGIYLLPEFFYFIFIIVSMIIAAVIPAASAWLHRIEHIY